MPNDTLKDLGFVPEIKEESRPNTGIDDLGFVSEDNYHYGMSPDVKHNQPLWEYAQKRYQTGKINIVRAGIIMDAWAGRITDDEMLNQGNEATLKMQEDIGMIDEIAFKHAPVRSMVGEAAEMLPFMGEAMKTSLYRGIQGGIAGYAAGLLTSGPDPTDVGFTMAGMKVGQAYGVIEASLKIEGGNAYYDMISNGVPREVALPLSLAAGTAIGIIESAQLEMLASPFKRAIFKKALTSKAGKNAIAQAVKRFAKTYIGEIAEEDLQEIVSLTTETIASAFTSDPRADVKPSDWGKRIVDTTVATAKAMGIITLPGGAVDVKSTLNEYKKQQKATQEEITGNKVSDIVIQPEEADVKKSSKTEQVSEPIEGVYASLIEEAKKYKTAEEFVEGQATLYHGSDVDIDKFDMSKVKKWNKFGHFFSPDKEAVKVYGDKINQAEVVVNNPKIITQKQWWDIRGEHAKDDVWFSNWKKQLKEQGYDGLLVKGSTEQFAGQEVKNPEILVAFEDSQIKTKQQLTDIWNKANKEKLQGSQAKKEPSEYETEESFIEDKIQFKQDTGKLPKTGEPFTANFVKIKQKSVYMGERFGQDIEPSGVYISITTRDVAKNLPSEIVKSGVVELKNPLVIEYKSTTKEGWKTDLSNMYEGKTGKELTEAIKKDGYDGIITINSERNIINETVVFNEESLGAEEALKDQYRKSLKEKTKKERKPLSQKLRDIRTKFKREKTIALKEAKAVQEEVINTLKASDLSASDKASFISTIKNTQTVRQLRRNIQDIERRIVEREQKQIKRDISKNISKLLKKTRPVKKGSRSVGKFDYTTNKIMDEYRSLAKLTKAKAQEELKTLPDPTSDIEAMKNRMITFKAKGMDASVELLRQVQADIDMLIQEGQRAKSEEDFLKAAKRSVLKEDALSGMQKFKLNKSKFRTKVANAFMRGFGDIESFFNVMFGRDFSEKYSPVLAESNKETAIYQKISDISKNAQEIFGIEDKNSLVSKIQNMAKEEFNLFRGDNIVYDLSKMDLIDIYNCLKNDMLRERYYNAYGKEQIDSLMANLTEEDMDFADMLMDSIQDYWPVLNQRRIEIDGRDLPRVENYWPATSERFEIDFFDDYRQQGEFMSAQKERVKSTIIVPIPKNAWIKTLKHITEAEHVDKVSRQYESLKRMLIDPEVKNSIERKFGKDVYHTLNRQIDRLSLHNVSESLDAISGVINFILGNWVKSKVAINPDVFIKQLLSSVNYADKMPFPTWAKVFAEGLSNPKETLKFMWENAPFLEARFKRGYSEALATSLGVYDLKMQASNWSETMTILTRMGDIGAIVYGGYPYVKHLMKTMSKEEAFAKFEKETLRAQQSRLVSTRSDFQNANNFGARILLAFKNITSQYLRKTAEAIIGYTRGEVSKQDLAKTLFIYSVIAPTLYSFAGVAMAQTYKAIGAALGLGGEPDDAETFWNNTFMAVMTQLALNPFNAIPVIDKITEYSIRQLTEQEAWDVISTPVFDDIEKTVTKMFKEYKEPMDYVQIMAPIVELATGVSVQKPINIWKKLTGQYE